MGIQLLNTDVYGPLPSQTWGLLLGRSSITIKGLTIYPGVIDSDYTGEIKIMASARDKIIDLPTGTRIAQLLILPYHDLGLPAVSSQSREAQGFGSSNAYWVQSIKKQRPEITLLINKKSFRGLLDTRADVSVIAYEHWPKHWPLQETFTSLQGIGQTQTPLQSAALLEWANFQGQTGIFQPYVVKGLPVNLWGCDIMSSMNLHIGGPGPETPFV